MIYFKHFSGTFLNNGIQELIEAEGSESYAAYIVLCEIASKEYFESGCTIEPSIKIHPHTLARLINITRDRASRILQAMIDFDVLDYEEDEDLYFFPLMKSEFICNAQN